MTDVRVFVAVVDDPNGVVLEPDVAYSYMTLTVTDPGQARTFDQWDSPRLFQFGWFALGTTVPPSDVHDGLTPYYNPPIWIEQKRMFLPSPQPGAETPDLFWCGRIMVGLVAAGSVTIELWNYS
jgi:hypothetical protein